MLEVRGLRDAGQRCVGVVPRVGPERRRRSEHVEGGLLAAPALLRLQHARQADEARERVRELGHLAQPHEVPPRARDLIVGVQAALEDPGVQRRQVGRGEQQVVDRAHLPRLRHDAVGCRDAEHLAADRAADRRALGADLTVVQRELGLATRAADDQRIFSRRR